MEAPTTQPLSTVNNQSLSPSSYAAAALSFSWDGGGGGVVSRMATERDESASSFDAATGIPEKRMSTTSAQTAPPTTNLHTAISDSWIQAHPPPLPPSQLQQQRSITSYQNPGWNQQYFHHDQRDNSQHSRGSIWVEDQSRSSHASTYGALNGSRTGSSGFIFGEDYHASQQYNNAHSYHSSPELEKDCLPQCIAQLSLHKHNNIVSTGIQPPITNHSIGPNSINTLPGHQLGLGGTQPVSDFDYHSLNRKTAKEIPSSMPYNQNPHQSQQHSCLRPPTFSPVIEQSPSRDFQQNHRHQAQRKSQVQQQQQYQQQNHYSFHNHHDNDQQAQPYSSFGNSASSVATMNTYSSNSIPGLMNADSGLTSSVAASWSTPGAPMPSSPFLTATSSSTLSHTAPQFHPHQQQQQHFAPSLAPPLASSSSQTMRSSQQQQQQPPPGFGMAKFVEEEDKETTAVALAAAQHINSRRNSPPSALQPLSHADSSLTKSPLPAENILQGNRRGSGSAGGKNNNNRGNGGVGANCSNQNNSNNNNNNNKNRQKNKRGKKQDAPRGPGNRSPTQYPLKEQPGAVNTKLESTASPSSTLTPSSFGRAVSNESETVASSEALRQLMKPPTTDTSSYTVAEASWKTSGSTTTNTNSTLYPNHLEDTIEGSSSHGDSYSNNHDLSILPQQPPVIDDLSFGQDSDDDTMFQYGDDDESEGAGTSSGHNPYGLGPASSPRSKKREWLLRMNRKLGEIPVGELDSSVVSLPAIMNAWAKTKSAQGASMVEMWLKRAQQEYEIGNHRVIPTTKMYTMAVDAWARSGEGGAAAQRAEALLQQMNDLYQSGGHEALRPTTGIFNAVINAWARSREKIAPVRAEQILNWMHNLQNLDVQPDKYTFNTVIHAWAKAGGPEAAAKAQELLTKMHNMFQEGDIQAKPDTITYNVVINAWAKSGGKGAATEAEKLLQKMHSLHEMGDPDVKPNVVTYGAVIDSFAKSGEPGAASRADTLLAQMIQLHQSDPVRHTDLLPNTYVFNTVINCWAKSKEHDAASKAEEMLVAMSRLHASGMPSLKPDAFTYTAVIDAWAKSGYRGAAARADQLLDKMEAKYLAGDVDLKPNTFTYNAVINALAKSGEAGAAARAERVLQNMVNRHRNGGGDDVKPTTINFNTVLDAWAKSGGGRAAAERAEEILEWMDRLHKGGNADVKPDTITFNAVLDAWARSGDRIAPRRAEQILDHMDELQRAGNHGVKPDTYTYNTLINAWAKSGERGAAARAEHVLSIMEKRYRDGDRDFKPNTRTHTSVIDAWAKSGEKGAARRAEQILNNMISRFDATGDPDIKPNVHTANAVCNACAFSKHDEDRAEALQIAFRVFDWLSNQADMKPDSYTYTILLSVCANLLPREDGATRFAHARAFFESCRDAGYVNDYVLRKLRQTVSDHEYLRLVDYRSDPSASSMPTSWTRNAKIDARSKGRKSGNSGWTNNRRKGK